MRGVAVLAFVLLTAQAAAASEEVEESARGVEKVQPTITERAPEAPEIELAPVAVEERAPAEDAAVQEMPARGSFWWLVGAIVVAGIILAVVL